MFTPMKCRYWFVGCLSKVRKRPSYWLMILLTLGIWRRTNMVTLRTQLTQLWFSWETGVIVFEPVSEEAYSPGWSGTDEWLERVMVTSPFEHELLDVEFDRSFGAPYMPRFFAEDSTRIYFPGTHDGAQKLLSN